MIEGQEDVTWPDWVALADACETAGIEALFRSDHYLSGDGQIGRGSHDAWTTLAAIAARSSRIRLGTMVSPVTFRHPSLVANAATTVDHISGGRVELGLGAGLPGPAQAAAGTASARDRGRRRQAPHGRSGRPLRAGVQRGVSRRRGVP
jgi:alkanesulfonate monooxygenase SsuD/methylene tetrahydromethanopterin reductase-like flavin-dependent oxidoreductase (luciferase family)